MLPQSNFLKSRQALHVKIEASCVVGVGYGWWAVVSKQVGCCRLAPTARAAVQLPTLIVHPVPELGT